MRTDLEVILKHRELVEVVEPFSDSDSTLPRTWSRRRVEILTATPALESADAAVVAARTLKEAFVAVAGNRFDKTDSLALISDINRILVLLEAVTGGER